MKSYHLLPSFSNSHAELRRVGTTKKTFAVVVRQLRNKSLSQSQTDQNSNLAKAKKALGARSTSARLFAFNEGCATYHFPPHSMVVGSQTSNTKVRSAQGFWPSHS